MGRPSKDPLAKTITDLPPKFYRPRLKTHYQEADFIPDNLDEIDIIFKQFGSSVSQTKKTLTPRDDIILFDPTKHDDELSRNLNRKKCPEEDLPAVINLIQKHWDV
jgi:hypothetical protein